MLWLQKETDITAKDLLQKLDGKYPGQFGNKLPRTLQRRIGEWRGTMPRRLVFGGVEERNDLQAVVASVCVAGQATLRLATLASAWPTLQVSPPRETTRSDTGKSSFYPALVLVTFWNEATGGEG